MKMWGCDSGQALSLDVGVLAHKAYRGLYKSWTELCLLHRFVMLLLVKHFVHTPSPDSPHTPNPNRANCFNGGSTYHLWMASWQVLLALGLSTYLRWPSASSMIIPLTWKLPYSTSVILASAVWTYCRGEGAGSSPDPAMVPGMGKIQR